MAGREFYDCAAGDLSHSPPRPVAEAGAQGESPEAFEEDLSPREGAPHPHWWEAPSWIKLRRVKDEYQGVTKEGVTRWSYAYTLDGVAFISGVSLACFPSENIVRQGAFVLVSNQLVENLILLCESAPQRLDSAAVFSQEVVLTRPCANRRYPLSNHLPGPNDPRRPGGER